MIYLNGGPSGIGGGLVNDGSLMTGTSGYAGELGHTLVNSGGSLCHCGSTGCLETEVSRAPLLDALGLTTAKEADLLEETLRQRLADESIPGLRELVDRQVDFLAVALKNAVNFLNPRLIVLGGFLGVLLEVAPERLNAAVSGSAMTGPREAVQITRASHGSDLLIIGAAQLALEQVLADPSRFSRPLAQVTPI
jgi:predicted NBD/HSP70 family sugar kinase